MNRSLFTYTVFYFICFWSIGSNAEIYVYPERIEPVLECNLDQDIKTKIEKSYSDIEAGSRGLARAYPVDLNSDEICEIFLDEPSIWEGTSGPVTSILLFENGEYITAGSISGTPQSWWYGKQRNGYPRIFVPGYTGHKTNPVYVTNVLYLENGKLKSEFNSKFSHGRFMELALVEYKKGRFDIAEKYFLNAFRMNKIPKLRDANNLAITWIKQDKLDEAESILMGLLEQSGDTRQKAAAYYNLGKIHEIRNMLSKALEFYTKSNAAQSTSARTKKIEEIKNLINQ